MTGLACPIYCRHELRKSIKDLVFVGVFPGLGGLLMLAVFVASCLKLKSTPFWIGITALLVGLPAMALAQRFLPEFFKRKPEVVSPADVS
jgi:hypothetical protein